MAKARPIEGLEAEEPYAAAAAKIVAVRAREVADHSRDVLDVADIERVHDMRVATRRLRAALEIFEPCFPRSSTRTALRRGEGDRRRARRAARPRRHDRQRSSGSRDGLASPDRPGVASLIEQIRAEQAEANAAARGVRRARPAGRAVASGCRSWSMEAEALAGSGPT